MADPFTLSTGDPLFDPAKPVVINGYRFEPHGRANVIWADIQRLTAEEGCSVTILCPNPDFNGQPDHAIECNGDWTGWVDQRFAHDNIVECFRMAVARMEEVRRP